MFEKKINRLKSEIIVETVRMNLSNILPHEKIYQKRSEGMHSYVKSLEPWVILPSILVCRDSKVIIDGHHRFYVLKKLNYSDVPVSLINYKSNLIVTHSRKEKCLGKNEIVSAGVNKKLLKPKSSLHHISVDSKYFPIILLSDLILINR